MVEIFLSSYIQSFKSLLENLEYLREKGLQEPSEPTVAVHYVNPDDERSLQGVGPDSAKIDELYTKKAEGEDGQQN